MKEQEVIGNLKKLASRLKHKKYITLEDISSVPKLRYSMYFHFKAFGKALQAAGVPLSPRLISLSISDENLLSYLRDLRKALGFPPTVWDIRHDEKLYKKYSDVKITWKKYKRFGGLSKAKELAGIKDSEVKVSSEHSTGGFETDKEILPKNRFWGEAAELHVLAELLYHEFQAANIPVDVGLDILAVKNNKTFYFQVKHKDLSDNKAIKLTKSSFKRTGAGNVYYIFVLLSENKRDFLIIPYSIVNQWVKQGLTKEEESNYLIYINKKDGKYMFRDQELDYFLDGWEDIK